jgi:nucleotide-binding universal stress UspA family protein
MYKHILAAVNEHSNSEQAARYALGLARVCGARLTLVFAAVPGSTREVLHLGEAAVKRLFEEALAQGLEAESVVRAGQPLAVIRELVHTTRVNLVFAATRHEDLSRRFFLKTLARDLMLRLPCSVALVRVVHPGRLHPRRILVPFRGRMTKLAERAEFVALLAHAFGAEVTLFHAPGSLTDFFRGERLLSPEEREASVPRDMDRFIACLEGLRIPHERRLGRGRVASAITVEAAVRRSDLIVMGASERGLLSSVLAGNPVEEVLRETPCNFIMLLPRLASP